MHIFRATRIGGYMFLQHCSSRWGGHKIFDHQIGGSQKYCRGTFGNSWPPVFQRKWWSPNYLTYMWCTPTKQGTSCTGLFKMGNWSWHRGEKWLISCQFWDFVSLCILICFLSPPCNFWHKFPTKNSTFSAACHISKTIGIGNIKGRFLNITLPEKPLKRS